ncbi:hypothetical protein AGOR_G00166290 [Albula goreensis]|uniref:Uncharacterized protein n=1 Tax=Albula goreensis TaxID=1534307 RepID=A0A8T3D277_9TELE|nr:hypothetical protein AGOR_G00166290 [Albula goreensis]
MLFFRSGMLTRHRSMNDASQSLRQIEMPRKSVRVGKPNLHLPAEKPSLELPPPQKQAVQEVTKVRRNLFNQDSKLPRSQSVSAVEGIKRKRLHLKDSSDRHTLLTKNVAETPLHKQVSNRLLHRLKTGRKSDPSDMCIVEESPIKPMSDLRRSPRIKNLSFTRRHSSSFYSSSQMRSRNLDRVLSSSQLSLSDSKLDDFSVTMVRSPMRLLFGATESPKQSASLESCNRRSRRRHFLGSADSEVFESPKKSPRQNNQKQIESVHGGKTPRKSPHKPCRNSPRTPSRKVPPPPSRKSPHTPSRIMPNTPSRKSPRTPSRIMPSTPSRRSPRAPSRKSLCTPSKSSPHTPSRKAPHTPLKMSGVCPSESPVTGFALGETRMKLRGSPFRSPSHIDLVMATPQKDSPVQTPAKSVSQPLLLGKSCVPYGKSLESPSRTPRKCVTWSPSSQKMQSEGNGTAFKVPDSPCLSSRSSPRLLGTPVKFNSPFKSLKKAGVFKTPDECIISPKSLSSITPKSPRPGTSEIKAKTSQYHGPQRSSERIVRKLGTPGKDDPVILSSQLKFCLDSQRAKAASPPDHYSPQTPSSKHAQKSPCTTNSILTRSRGTPDDILSEVQFLTPEKTKVTTRERSFRLAASEPKLKTSNRTHCENTTDISASSPNCKTVPEQGRVIRGMTKRYSSSQSDNCDQMSTVRQNRSMPSTMLQQELVSGSLGTPKSVSTQLSLLEVDLDVQSDSQQLDSSQATTEDDSIDICNAMVVKTQLSGGIKMNVTFSKKPSKSDIRVESTPLPSSSTTPGRSYGFRRTADRQQRAAAARIGSPEGVPRFSTPRASKEFRKQPKPSTPDALTYQVELEMQASGLPKLKFKRTDSFSAQEDTVKTSTKMRSHGQVTVKPSRVDSPLSHCAKHRDAGYASPSLCTHATPAKSTPGKGGVQTYICQSYTPTGHTASTPSPSGAGELAPWTPSPQSRGRCTPENLDSWPRRKRARSEVTGVKEKYVRGDPLHEEMEDPELEGIYRLQEPDEFKEMGDQLSMEVAGLRSREQGSGGILVTMTADKSQLGRLEDTDIPETLHSQFAAVESLTCDDRLPWFPGEGSVLSAVTPPSTKIRKPVSASGILALTHSPLLYKSKKQSKADCNFRDELESGSHVNKMGSAEQELSPFSQPPRRQPNNRTYSRKRLLN